MKNIDNLQKILLGFFLIIAILAVGVFSGYLPIGKKNKASQDSLLRGDLVIWGVLSPFVVDPALRALEKENENNLKIKYIQKDFYKLELEYTEALVKNNGPDLVLFTNFQLLTLGDKLYQIPFQSFPRSQFESEYIDAARVFLSSTGIIGIPFALDPMVLYYNKNILAQNYLFEPPKYWDEYPKFSETFTDRDGANIKKSAIAMGSFDNLTYPVDFLSMLFLQTLNPIGKTYNNGYISTLKDNYFNSNISLSAYVLDFFNSFSDSQTSYYSWNRAMNKDKQEFLGGRLALYFGFASDSGSFIQNNPNLNVGVSKVPQFRDLPEATVGRMYAFGINPRSANIDTSFAVMWQLSGRVLGSYIGSQFGMQPIFKSQISPTAETDLANLIFQQSAFISKAWPDPNPSVTYGIFREMVEDSVAGILTEEQSINRANREIEKAYEQVLK